VLAAALLAAGLAACQRADEQAGDTRSTTLTVYASVALQGPGGADARAVADGARLALREAGGTVGELVIKLAVLDASTPAAGRWDPEQTADNARAAVRDRTAIAYLGDGPSGATAISLPILNAAGIPQISPESTYAGFTEAGGAGEPERFSPSGTRTFARPVPADAVQARALAALVDAQGCRRLALIADDGLAGRGLAAALAGTLAPEVQVVAPGGLSDPARVAARVAGERADCAVYTGALSDRAPRLFDALHAADRRMALFGAAGVASETFAAGLRPGTQQRTRLAAPPGILEPRRSVRAFARTYRDTFGVAARSGALYGYEAMQLALEAIRRAGAEGNDRAAVARALFDGTTRRGVLGPYRIDRAGDTTSAAYTTWRSGTAASRACERWRSPAEPGGGARARR
jgi:branched-chain amino acid transport system substrate-binding protein